MAGADEVAGSNCAASDAEVVDVGEVASADEVIDVDTVDFVEEDGADRFLVNMPTGNSRK